MSAGAATYRSPSFARLIAAIVGFDGDFVFDRDEAGRHPAQAARRLQADALGWRPRIDLGTGIRQTYGWYRAARDKLAT